MGACQQPNGLFYRYICRGSEKEISEAINFIWSIREWYKQEAKPVQRQVVFKRIIEFWQWIYMVIDSGKIPNHPQLASETVHFLFLIDEINESNYNLLELAAMYSDVRHNSSIMLEILDLLKDKGDRVITARYIGNLYLAMLKGATPNYHSENMQSIFSFLVNTQDLKTRSLAQQIFEKYALTGSSVFSDIWKHAPTLEIN